MELMQASNQWMTRPDDERYTSLTDMLAHFERIRSISRQGNIASRSLKAVPTGNKGIILEGPKGQPAAPTNWAFGQLAKLGGAPAGYLRELPAPIAADCLNYGLQYARDVEDVQVLLQVPDNGEMNSLRAATGPNYGRIWNRDVVGELVSRFGDGITGAFRVPGEFGKAVEVDKRNTTLYASDRDMFVFLADEEHRVEIPNRRNGLPGSLARGFFVWNSEVGGATFGIGTFLFDYVCMNRIVWGATEYKQVTIRHTSKAPTRFIEQMTPAIRALSEGSTHNIVQAIEAARAKRIDDELDTFLANRFGKGLVGPLKAIHDAEEGRPIESLWDATTAATAYARGLKHQDARVAIEVEAGKVMRLAA